MGHLGQNRMHLPTLFHTCNPSIPEVSGTPLFQTCFMDYKKGEFHETFNYSKSRIISNVNKF